MSFDSRNELTFPGLIVSFVEIIISHECNLSWHLLLSYFSYTHRRSMSLRYGGQNFQGQELYFLPVWFVSAFIIDLPLFLTCSFLLFLLKSTSATLFWSAGYCCRSFSFRVDTFFLRWCSSVFHIDGVYTITIAIILMSMFLRPVETFSAIKSLII